jgi:3-oxoacyl-(acyl-carrier-protein) synthase
MAPVDRFLHGNLAAAVAKALNVEGPSMTVTNACASGTDAIGIAMSWIKAGICDVAIAGGADELNRVPLAGFNSLGILSPALCSPFDVNRQGLNLGEGAGIVVLEKTSTAHARGIHSDLFAAGFGTACDAYHLTSPRPDGAFLKAAVERALAEAGLAPEEIAFVNAHGTATPDNDRVEGAVLADVFGRDVVVLSTKGYTGHTLGAAGGVEAVFSALALRSGWIPLCAGFCEKDPDIPVVPVREQTAIDGVYAMSTSLAFGGGNSALVIGCDREGR